MHVPTSTPTPPSDDQELKSSLLIWLWIVLGSFLAFGLLVWFSFKCVKEHSAKQARIRAQTQRPPIQVHLENLRQSDRSWQPRASSDGRSLNDGWTPPAYYSPLDGHPQ